MISTKFARGIGLLFLISGVSACSTATSTPPPAPRATLAVVPTEIFIPTNTPVIGPVTPAVVVPAVLSSATKSAGLRAGLDRLLSEHVVLAGNATSAALAGRTKDFEASASALDANSVDLSKAFGGVYGDAFEKAFLPLWRKHIGLIVDYTSGLAAKDKTKSDKAQTALAAYAD